MSLMTGKFSISDADFARLMAEVAATYGRALNAGLLTTYRRILGEYSLEVLQQAIDAHLSDQDAGRFFPTPAHLLAKIPGRAWLSADEAWAVCLKSLDEWATVVVSDVIMSARAIALPILESGDKIGARMAFREAYDRILADRGGQQGWYISLGYDKSSREEVALQAVQAGMITMDAAIALVPDLRYRDVDAGQKQLSFWRASISYHPPGLDS